jgi:hypothetical protein
MPDSGRAYLGDLLLFEEEPIFIDDTGKKYYEKDCHIFVANGYEIKLPIPADDPDNCPAVFVAVNGVEVTPTIPNDLDEWTDPYWTFPASDGNLIHAIFDWDNSATQSQDWFSDILQFGLNSETGKRNQLNNGWCAFLGMSDANPTAIIDLDISNVTDMHFMFGYSPFNQPIGEWDTSNVTDMARMFKSSSFNQDISQWCVSKITSKPIDFDLDSGFEGETSKQPQWGEPC